MTRQYSIYLIWSKEDGSYVAKVSELPGCMADGPTPEKALENVQQIINEWIEVAKEDKRQIPAPMTLEDYEALQAEFRRSIEEHIQREIQTAVQRIMGSLKDPDQFSLLSHRITSFPLTKTR